MGNFDWIIHQSLFLFISMRRAIIYNNKDQNQIKERADNNTSRIFKLLLQHNNGKEDWELS